MKKVLKTLSLTGLLVIGVSSQALAWSWGNDSFCDQFSDPKTTLADLINKGITQVDYDAQFKVAQMYEHGCGTDKSLPLAYAWYDACSDENPEAAKQKASIYSTFNKDDRQSALRDATQLEMKMSSYAENKEAKKHLEYTNGEYASQHPAAVIQQFNQDFQKVQDE